METGFSGEEHWKLSAQEFTDMCAVQLSHVLKQANNGSTMTPGDEALGIMAEHLGGAALAQYQEEINALAEAGQRANALGKGGLSGQTPAELEGVDAEALAE